MGTVEIRGIAYPVETYKVIDLVENLPEINSILQTDLPGLVLEADFDRMTKEQRDEALEVLHEAIRRIEKK
jgi:hypothetical protein